MTSLQWSNKQKRHTEPMPYIEFHFAEILWVNENTHRINYLLVDFLFSAQCICKRPFYSTNDNGIMDSFQRLTFECMEQWCRCHFGNIVVFVSDTTFRWAIHQGLQAKLHWWENDIIRPRSKYIIVISTQTNFLKAARLWMLKSNWLFRMLKILV